MKEKKNPKEPLPVRAVVVRKYVGTESMEAVFKEIAEHEIEEILKEFTKQKKLAV